MPFSKDIFISVLIGSQISYLMPLSIIAFIPSTPELFLDFSELIIFSISSGDVGLRYIEVLLGTDFIYCSGDLFALGMDSAHFFPTVEKRTSFVIFCLSLVFWLSIVNVSVTLLLSFVRPMIVLINFQVFRVSLLYCVRSF